VSAPTFVQPERRSFLAPILLAVAAIAVAIGIAMYFFPATTINADHIQTSVLPTETKFNGSTIVGIAHIEHVLFVASTIRVDNQLRVPIDLDDFHLTVIGADNTELTESAVRTRDLPDMETNYPALKPLITKLLERETSIDPKNSAQGTVVFSLTIPKDVWDQRKSAVIKVDVYHQNPVYVTIPK